jgi:hypothetical protein
MRGMLVEISDGDVILLHKLNKICYVNPIGTLWPFVCSRFIAELCWIFHLGTQLIKRLG